MQWSLVHERIRHRAKLGKAEAKKETASPEVEALLASLADDAEGERE